jgi:hypothetical protein
MASTWYVYPGATGMNNGTTTTDAWVSLASAMAAGTPVAAGDTVYCRGVQTLTNYILLAVAGTAAAGLIKYIGVNAAWADDGTRYELTGSNNAGGTSVSLSMASKAYIQLKNFYIHGLVDTQNGIAIYQLGAQCIIQNCLIDATTGAGKLSYCINTAGVQCLFVGTTYQNANTMALNGIGYSSRNVDCVFKSCVIGAQDPYNSYVGCVFVNNTDSGIKMITAGCVVNQCVFDGNGTGFNALAIIGNYALNCMFTNNTVGINVSANGQVVEWNNGYRSNGTKFVTAAGGLLVQLGGSIDLSADPYQNRVGLNFMPKATAELMAKAISLGDGINSVYVDSGLQRNIPTLTTAPNILVGTSIGYSDSLIAGTFDEAARNDTLDTSRMEVGYSAKTRNTTYNGAHDTAALIAAAQAANNSAPAGGNADLVLTKTVKVAGVTYTGATIPASSVTLPAAGETWDGRAQYGIPGALITPRRVDALESKVQSGYKYADPSAQKTGTLLLLTPIRISSIKPIYAPKSGGALCEMTTRDAGATAGTIVLTMPDDSFEAITPIRWENELISFLVPASAELGLCDITVTADDTTTDTVDAAFEYVEDDCITARITADIVATLETLDSYGGVPGKVEEEKLIHAPNGRYPYVEVCGPVGSPNPQTTKVAMTELRYTIKHYTQANDEGDANPAISYLARNIIADIVKCLMVDQTRGNIALSTEQEEFGNAFLVDEASGAVEFCVYVNIMVRTRIDVNNPYSLG